jgi:protease-4
VLVGILILVGLAFLFLPRGPRIAPGSVLLFDLEGAYPEMPAPPLVARLLGRHVTPFPAVLSELAKAERDDRLATVVLRIRSLSVGWGKAQELRDAIARLRARGRRTIAYLEVEQYGSNLEYYVAAAADRVVLAPGTRSPLMGLAAEYLFLGGLWAKLGVELEVERIGAYKSAAETLAEREMSAPNREMAEALLDSIEAQFVAGIAEGRKLEPAAVRAVIDAAPMTAEEFLAAKLVDRIAFLDQILAEESGSLVRAREYAAVDPASVGFDPVAQVALVYGSGSVVTGEGGESPTGVPVLASQTVSEALADAAEDPEIKGVILRIDSPGGSALASDLVWRATQEVRRKGKPVVASFSDVAASGGYYVACGADAIVAEPGTLTGSIGVFVLRPVLRGLFEKLDVGVASLTRGTHAGFLLSNEPLSPATRERLRSDVRGVYDLFVSRVAEGRSLAPETVDGVGRGRVWTGAQAEERDLVDRLGGLREAVNLVKERLDLRPDQDVALVPYPRPRPLLERIAENMRGAAAQASIDALPLPAGLRKLAVWLAAVPVETPVLVPPVVVDIR